MEDCPVNGLARVRRKVLRQVACNGYSTRYQGVRMVVRRTSGGFAANWVVPQEKYKLLSLLMKGQGLFICPATLHVLTTND